MSRIKVTNIDTLCDLISGLTARGVVFEVNEIYPKEWVIEIIVA